MQLSSIQYIYVSCYVVITTNKQLPSFTNFFVKEVQQFCFLYNLHTLFRKLIVCMCTMYSEFFSNNTIHIVSTRIEEIAISDIDCVNALEHSMANNSSVCKGREVV